MYGSNSQINKTQKILCGDRVIFGKPRPMSPLMGEGALCIFSVNNEYFLMISPVPELRNRPPARPKTATQARLGSDPERLLADWGVIFSYGDADGRRSFSPRRETAQP
jgi:hypothetical protein